MPECRSRPWLVCLRLGRKSQECIGFPLGEQLHGVPVGPGVIQLMSLAGSSPMCATMTVRNRHLGQGLERVIVLVCDPLVDQLSRDPLRLGGADVGSLQDRSQTALGRDRMGAHEFDPEDSMRFYALRLREVGMIKSTPNEILAQGTDWRFVNELKRELKA
jgi:hypothetical protein